MPRIFLELVQNIALLLSLCMAYSFLYTYLRHGTYLQKIINGALFGLFCILGMMIPFNYGEGIIFDGRSIIISLAGLFGGFVPALIAAVLASAYRLALGGTGAVMGLSVTAASAVIGVIFHFVRQKKSAPMTIRHLYLFGILVHLAMVFLALATLPPPQHVQVFKTIFFPVMILYPVGTVLIAVLLLHEESRFNLQQALTTSEAKYREIVELAGSIILRFNRQGRITFFNEFAQRFFGYSADEILGKNVVGTIVPETDSAGRDLSGMFVHLIQEPEKFINNENENICRDGRRVWIAWTNKPVMDAAGHLLEILSIGNDINDRKRTDDLQHRSEASLHKANKAYRALSACNEAVARATDEEALLQEAVRIIQQDCGYRLVWIGYAEHDEARTVRPVAQAGYEDGYLDTVSITWADTERGCGPTGTAIRTGAFCVFNDVHTDPLFAPWRDEAIRRGYCSVACFPLRSGDEILGALTVYAETPAAFAEEELQLLMKLAGSLAYGIVSLRMNIKHKQAEAALRESEERFRKLAESAPIAIMIFNKENWIYTNPAGEAISGYTAEELSGMKPWDLIHPDHRDLVRSRSTQRLQGKDVLQRYEFKIITKTGKERWIDCTAARIEINEAPAVIIAVIDITGRKQAEETLCENEALIRSMFEADPTGVSLTVDRVFKKTNRRFSEITGYSEEDLKGQNVRMLYADDAEFNRVGKELYQDLQEHGIGAIESRWRRRDGTIIDVLLSISPLNPQDWSAGITATAVDITERKRSENEIRQARDYIENIFKASPDSILVIDPDGYILMANDSVYSVYGYRPEEIVGQHVSILSVQEKKAVQKTFALIEELYETGCVKDCACERRHKDGRIIEVEVSIVLLKNPDGTFSAISSNRDITDKKRMEKALEQRIIALTRPLDAGAGIDFEDLFNLEDIQKLQDKFARATAVASIITLVDGTPITKPSNFCRLCQTIIRQTEKGLKKCNVFDGIVGRQNPNAPIVQACPSGLWHAGASITVGGRHIANWLIGQVRNEAQDEAVVRQYAREIGADEDIFMQAFYEVPVMSREKFNEIAQALHNLAGQMSSMAYQNIQQARFISDISRVEDSLRESKEELLNIINNSVDGIYLLDEAGMVIEWNPGCEKIAQLPKQKAIGMYIWDIYYEYLPDEIKGPDARDAFKTAFLNQYTQTTLFSEYTIQCPDGSLKIIQNNGFPIKTAKGYMRGVITRDVTDIRHSEQEQLRLATAIEQADETVVITDKDGSIVYVNPAFERTTGYSREEAVGKNPRVLKSGRQNDAFYKELWETVSSGKTWKGHLINKKKDGCLFEEEATISPVKDPSGEISNYVAVKRDVTQQLQLEDQVRQTQKMEAIGTLAGGIAHDFNNILGGIMGYTELAIGEPIGSTKAQRYLREALMSADRARKLVKQILTFSRQTEQENKPVQAGLIIKEACKLLRASLPATIELRQQLQDNEALIKGDPTQIYQIVMNLCTNAHHAMRQSGGVLDIGVNKVDLADDDLLLYPGLQKAGTYLKLSVSDTGCGIPQEHLKKIFDPYFTTKEKGEGTGLGLAVVDGIVKSHGGAIKVSSTEGEGTTFEVLFPVLLFEESPSPGAEAAAPLAHGSETILFVDDEESLRNVADKMLQQLGYRVVLASNAGEALEKFLELQNDINLVITDKTMPRMTGFELARSIKDLRPDIPVVMCTGYGEAKDLVRAEDVGISEFVMKPLRQQVLAETVRRVLDGRAT